MQGLRRRSSPAWVHAGLLAGHAINLEDPEAFNRHPADFFHAVDIGRWPERDQRAMSGAIFGTCKQC
jgi:hypothetical protein